MGEVSEMFDVNPSLIRFWEQKFDILKPDKNKKGNRLFTPTDVENLKLIYHLVKEEGMTLAGAQKRIKQNPEGLKRDLEIVDRLQQLRALLLEVRQELKGANDTDDVIFVDESVSSASEEELSVLEHSRTDAGNDAEWQETDRAVAAEVKHEEQPALFEEESVDEPWSVNPELLTEEPLVDVPDFSAENIDDLQPEVPTAEPPTDAIPSSNEASKLVEVQEEEAGSRNAPSAQEEATLTLASTELTDSEETVEAIPGVSDTTAREPQVTTTFTQRIGLFENGDAVVVSAFVEKEEPAMQDQSDGESGRETPVVPFQVQELWPEHRVEASETEAVDEDTYAESVAEVAIAHAGPIVAVDTEVEAGAERILESEQPIQEPELPMMPEPEKTQSQQPSESTRPQVFEQTLF